MHEDPAHRVVAKPALFVASRVDGLREAKLAGMSPLVGELGRVLENEDRPMAGGIPRVRRRKVAGEDLAFLDLGVGEEPVGCLGARPVLAGERDRAAHPVAQAGQKIAKASAQPSVFEGCLVHLAVRPVVAASPALVALTRHHAPHTTPRCEERSHNRLIRLNKLPAFAVSSSTTYG